MRATLDHRTSALLTFRNWLTASNLRLVVLLMTVQTLIQDMYPYRISMPKDTHRQTAWMGPPLHTLLLLAHWISHPLLLIAGVQHMYLEQPIDLSMVQLELFGTLATMLAWRALYTSVMRLFI